MANPIRRGLAGSQVSDWSPVNDEFTPLNQTSMIAPYGLRLQQTITSSGSVTIPAGIAWVYAIVVGGGGGGGNGGGGAGGVSWGWTLSQSTCIVGAGGFSAIGGYSRYGNIIAGGGGASAGNGVLGGGGGGGNTGAGAGGTNYWGIPGGAVASANTVGNPGSGAGGGGGTMTSGAAGRVGGNGI